jgi:hypothetical protein
MWSKNSDSAERSQRIKEKLPNDLAPFWNGAVIPAFSATERILQVALQSDFSDAN